MYDVTVIGAGVIGALITRELTKYDLSICLLEREADVSMGTTKANSAIVHAGYDAKNGSFKALLNVKGSRMMDKLSRELDVPFKKTGSIVVGFNDKEMMEIKKLYDNGIRNGVEGLKILKSNDVMRLEPNISTDVTGGLHASEAGIICPYELTVAAAENSVINGADLRLEHNVLDIKAEGGCLIAITDRGEVKSRYIINAAGLFGDTISRMVGEDDYCIKPRKGEYLLLDKNQGNLVSRVIFRAPSKMGKGILVTPTVDGNLLIGPNAQDILDREDTDTTYLGMKQVMEAALQSVPDISINDVITSFAGLRATSSRGDFIIESSKQNNNLINVSGIESPGLSASPAIAEYVVDILRKQGLRLTNKKEFNPIRKAIKKFSVMDDKKKHLMIMANPLYGRIICRCEQVTEGEIVEAIKRPAGAKNLDAVKRRTRAGMGRCQGGFCTPRLVDILIRELGVAPHEITKKGGNSRLLVGNTKHVRGDIDEGI